MQKWMILLLVWTLNVWSAPHAKKILTESAAQFKAYQGLKIDFKVESQSLMTGDKSQYSGELLTGASGQFKVLTPQIHLYSDAKTFWDYRPQAKQVLIKSFADVKMQLGPSQVLLQYLECEPTNIEAKTLGQSKVWKITLKPSTQLQQYSEIIVWVHQTTLKPVQMQTLDYSENQVKYEIKKFEEQKSLSQGNFQWKKLAEVEVIDMR